jgi:hypothetical protein
MFRQARGRFISYKRIAAGAARNSSRLAFAVSGIDLRLNALFGSDAKKGAFVRSLLHINAGDLKFTDEKDGSKKAVLRCLQ